MASFAPEEEELETMEDKIKYLRDRGVQIDIPGELRDETPASTSSATFDLGIDSHDLMIVKVPYDDKQQVEEVEVSIQDPYTYEGDQLLSKLKPNFASNLGSYHFSRENAMPVNGYIYANTIASFRSMLPHPSMESNHLFNVHNFRSRCNGYGSIQVTNQSSTWVQVCHSPVLALFLHTLNPWW